MGYYKELVLLQEQIYQKNKDPEIDFEAIGVKYFDVTDGLQPDILKVLNTKLDQVQ